MLLVTIYLHELGHCLASKMVSLCAFLFYLFRSFQGTTPLISPMVLLCALRIAHHQHVWPMPLHKHSGWRPAYHA